ncbi:MAG: TRAP transporter small permease subunit [Rhodobiaceae bacterium]|nr:TRAP transporter small permease subunit [Rhodobiaceae bacterium]MCC0012873.1 TRAP transporter small permease subunit [Rhodobiaceae bacterium]MCC0019153.1 TRAP transporter small permease subunit [Rhodobiaceae bacterium]MCC0051053.1 TRAP transporter small permease subunit [Rhodobiaceae bacterium]MCC0060100.1 TRAP transporter small permease subunit [Rhodobiaceae bacterium]
MHILITSIDRTVRWLGAAISWCLIAMMVVQVAVVIARYVFGVGLIALQDAVIFGHGLAFLLASAWVLQRDEHVRVDVIHDRLGKDGRRAIDTVALLAFVIPACAVIGWYSFPYVINAFASLEGARQPGGLAGIFLLKGAILVFTASVALQALSSGLKRATGIRDEAWSPQHDGNRDT